jgi:hypothetical protein
MQTRTRHCARRKGRTVFGGNMPRGSYWCYQTLPSAFGLARNCAALDLYAACDKCIGQLGAGWMHGACQSLPATASYQRSAQEWRRVTVMQLRGCGGAAKQANRPVFTHMPYVNIKSVTPAPKRSTHDTLHFAARRIACTCDEAGASIYDIVICRI